MTSKDDFAKRFADLLRDAREVYPIETARIKFVKDDVSKTVTFVANSGGFVHWGLRLAGSVVLRDQSKPRIPEQNVMVDGDIVAKDSEFDFGGFVCNEELRSAPNWDGHFKKNTFKRIIAGMGCMVFIAVVVLLTFYGAHNLYYRFLN